MRNIKYLALEEAYFEVFKSIVSGKFGNFQQKIELLFNDLENRFQLYEKNKNELFIMEAKWYIEDEKKLFLNCYSDTDYTKRLKASIKALDNWLCPYCNIDKSREVEHYLPQDEFPEFSVMILNLIPSCSTCNKKKLSWWKDATTRLFLNAYFDEIPTEQFLFVRFNLSENTPILEFYIDTTWLTINPHLDTILKKHVDRLELPYRYSLEINDKYTELKHRMEISLDLSTSDSKKVIQEEYLVQKSRFWENYWLAVLYKTISESDELINYIRQKHS